MSDTRDMSATSDTPATWNVLLESWRDSTKYVCYRSWLMSESWKEYLDCSKCVKKQNAEAFVMGLAFSLEPPRLMSTTGHGR